MHSIIKPSLQMFTEYLFRFVYYIMMFWTASYVVITIVIYFKNDHFIMIICNETHAKLDVKSF